MQMLSSDQSALLEDHSLLSSQHALLRGELNNTHTQFEGLSAAHRALRLQSACSQLQRAGEGQRRLLLRCAVRCWVLFSRHTADRLRSHADMTQLTAQHRQTVLRRIVCIWTSAKLVDAFTVWRAWATVVRMRAEACQRILNRKLLICFNHWTKVCRQRALHQRRLTKMFRIVSRYWQRVAWQAWDRRAKLMLKLKLHLKHILRQQQSSTMRAAWSTWRHFAHQVWQRAVQRRIAQQHGSSDQLRAALRGWHSAARNQFLLKGALKRIVHHKCSDLKAYAWRKMRQSLREHRMRCRRVKLLIRICCHLQRRYILSAFVRWQQHSMRTLKHSRNILLHQLQHECEVSGQWQTAQQRLQAEQQLLSRRQGTAINTWCASVQRHHRIQRMLRVMHAWKQIANHARNRRQALHTWLLKSQRLRLMKIFHFWYFAQHHSKHLLQHNMHQQAMAAHEYRLLHHKVHGILEKWLTATLRKGFQQWKWMMQQDKVLASDVMRRCFGRWTVWLSAQRTGRKVLNRLLGKQAKELKIKAWNRWRFMNNQRVLRILALRHLLSSVSHCLLPLQPLRSAFQRWHQQVRQMNAIVTMASLRRRAHLRISWHKWQQTISKQQIVLMSLRSCLCSLRARCAGKIKSAFVRWQALIGYCQLRRQQTRNHYYLIKHQSQRCKLIKFFGHWRQRVNFSLRLNPSNLSSLTRVNSVGHALHEVLLSNPTVEGLLQAAECTEDMLAMPCAVYLLTPAGMVSKHDTLLPGQSPLSAVLSARRPVVCALRGSMVPVMVMVPLLYAQQTVGIVRISAVTLSSAASAAMVNLPHSPKGTQTSEWLLEMCLLLHVQADRILPFIQVMDQLAHAAHSLTSMEESPRTQIPRYSQSDDIGYWEDSPRHVSPPRQRSPSPVRPMSPVGIMPALAHAEATISSQCQQLEEAGQQLERQSATLQRLHASRLKYKQSAAQQAAQVKELSGQLETKDHELQALRSKMKRMMDKIRCVRPFLSFML